VRVSPAGFLHKTWHGINEVNVVAALGQPERVRAGGAANVDYRRRRGRRMAFDQFASTELLNSEGALLEARLLWGTVIVRRDRGIKASGRSLGHVALTSWQSNARVEAAACT
jgi:hypothetical protein